MNNLLNMIMMAVRAKIMPIWVKLRMWTTPTFLRTKVFAKVREFFVKLLDVRPRDKTDYYSLLSWLVSKRLAFALVVAVGVLSAIYIGSVLPDDFMHKSAGGVPTYKYRSLPLKFHTGPVKILARAGYIAYDGHVEKGAAVGSGTLYAPDGAVVYKGDFANNMYNGNGTLYYPTGTPQYKGGFTDNLYNGTGESYRTSGIPLHEGEYVNGEKNGPGTLYNSVGDAVYTGEFLHDEIVYADFLERPTTEAAALYTGKTAVYSSQTESCVTMPEIDALYSATNGSNTVDNEWTVDRVLVLKNSIMTEYGALTTLQELTERFGQPVYYGTAWVDLSEAVGWNQQAREYPQQLTEVAVAASPGLEDVYTVSDYDRDFQFYLYTFEKDGLLYSFYFTASGQPGFVMYALQMG